jgi:predicted flap endonuclease-1-like 5' DNA nuclease
MLWLLLIFAWFLLISASCYLFGWRRPLGPKLQTQVAVSSWLGALISVLVGLVAVCLFYVGMNAAVILWSNGEIAATLQQVKQRPRQPIPGQEKISVQTDRMPEPVAVRAIEILPSEGKSPDEGSWIPKLGVRYRVFKDDIFVLMVDVVHNKVSRTFADENRVVLNVYASLKYQADKDVSKRDLFREFWWDTNAIASSNDLLAIEPQLFKTFSVPKTPTSTIAFVTWLESHWIGTVKKFEPEYTERASKQNFSKITPALDKGELRDFVCPELNRMFSRDLKALQSLAPHNVLRTLNGDIQFLCFAIFFSLIWIYSNRTRIFVQSEAEFVDQIGDLDHENLNDSIDRQLRRVELLQAEYGQEYGFTSPRLPKPESPTLKIWHSSLDALRLEKSNHISDYPNFLEATTKTWLSELHTSKFFLRYLLYSLPPLGFIGTVIGIPSALKKIGEVLSNELAKQQSGVMGVVTELAYAFDTTLVALVLALVGTYFLIKSDADEERTVTHAEVKCLDAFVGKMRASKADFFDDLTRIPGIGEKNQNRLNIANIFTYTDLATTDDSVFEQIGLLQLAKKNRWRERAQDLALQADRNRPAVP